MKKIERAFLIVIALVITAFCFTACDDDAKSTNGTMTLVIGTEMPVSYTIDLDNVEIDEGALSILDYLNETQDLEYVVERSVYGAYLTKVGGLEQNSATGMYIYIYTSVEKDFDVSAYAVSVEHNGQVLIHSELINALDIIMGTQLSSTKYKALNLQDGITVDQKKDFRESL